MTTNTYRKGDKVIGLGRCGRPWPSRPVGTVTRRRAETVRVQWDDCCVEDDMDAADLVPVYWSTTLERWVTIPE